MPKRRYERREPTHEWAQLRPYLKDTAQIKYELIRPVILFGVSAKERAAETGEPRSTIHYQANLFDVSGMASLLPPEPPPPVPQLDKRMLPPPMRQAIVDLHTEYPEHHVEEIARIMYIQFGRRPSAQTIKLTLATGPKPSRTTRRFPLFAEMTDPENAGWLSLNCMQRDGPRPRLLGIGRRRARRSTQHSSAGLKSSLPDWLISPVAPINLPPKSHCRPCRRSKKCRSTRNWANIG